MKTTISIIIALVLALGLTTCISTTIITNDSESEFVVACDFWLDWFVEEHERSCKRNWE